MANSGFATVDFFRNWTLTLARAETRITIERFLALTNEITISEAAHGPADARRYEYDPTYMLRGLRELHLEFTLAD
jgi:hypothetical protein